jgi:hypothetical protein
MIQDAFGSLIITFNPAPASPPRARLSVAMITPLGDVFESTCISRPQRLATLPEQPQAGKDQQDDDDPFKRRWAEARERNPSDPNTDWNKREHPP